MLNASWPFCASSVPNAKYAVRGVDGCAGSFVPVMSITPPAGPSVHEAVPVNCAKFCEASVVMAQPHGPAALADDAPSGHELYRWIGYF